MKVTPRLFCPTFSVSPVLIQHLLSPPQWKVTNSSGLLCRWTDVNALVQNKFRSTIHVLSQHLLANVTDGKHQMNV